MYIWLGINVDGQLGGIKEKAKEIDKELAFTNSCFTLPLHISLKMSFAVDGAKFPEIAADIENYYSSVEPFEIDVRGIENEQVIVWIRMHECERLNEIHDALNDLLLKKYGIGLHEYDTDYKFHTTLFMDSDGEKINAAFERVKDTPIPKRLVADRFVIGTSQSGALGTYSVYKEITK